MEMAMGHDHFVWGLTRTRHIRWESLKSFYITIQFGFDTSSNIKIKMSHKM